MNEQYLAHWGIKGMKWGVRRYQNEDGTYTAEGKKRRKNEPYHEDYKRAHDKKPVSQMSDKELRERNNRLQAEKQYAELTDSSKYKKGKKIVNELVWATTAIGTLTAFYLKNKGTIDHSISRILDKVGPTVVSFGSLDLTKQK